MRPVVYTLFGLGLVAVGWFSASAKPPVVLDRAAPSEDFAPARTAPAQPATTDKAEFAPDVAYLPPGPETLKPLEPFAPPQQQRQKGFVEVDVFLTEVQLDEHSYIQLAQQYAELMTRDELISESTELQQKIAVKRSEGSLESVRETLREIINRYPSTPAAEQAADALQRLTQPAASEEPRPE